MSDITRTIMVVVQSELWLQLPQNTNAEKSNNSIAKTKKDKSNKRNHKGPECG